MAATMTAAVLCLVAQQKLAAASPDNGAIVTYTATGTFAATAVSGADTLKLAGQPFTITLTGSSALAPIQHGRNWAIFKPLPMTGNVYSGLVPNQAIPISSTTAAVDQTVGASEDILQAGFPVVVIGISLTVRANFPLPGGTIATPYLHPFSSVTLGPTATVTYSNTTASTVLAIQSGTLVATVPPSAPVAKAALASPSALVWLAAQALKPRSSLPASWL